MSQAVKSKKTSAKGPTGPVPDPEGIQVKRWVVRGHACPRNTIEASTAEEAARVYREYYQIFVHQPIDNMDELDEVA